MKTLKGSILGVILLLLAVSQSMAQTGVWEQVGPGGTNNRVYTIAPDGDDIYIGGNFTNVNGSPTSRIAKWDGVNWSALGDGFNSTVYTIIVRGNDVYAAGAFTTSGGDTLNRIAKWNGTSWSPLGSGLNSTVYQLIFIGNDLYAVGAFTQAGGNPANRVAKWDGANWSALGTGLNHVVYAATVIGSDLYVGGVFTQAGGNPSNRIAKWNGTSWSVLGQGVDNNIYALATDGSMLYAGGDFETAGGDSVKYIAKWNGANWSGLGTGLEDTPFALAVNGNDVYAGGFFTEAGGNPANYIARWNGTSWSPLGSGTNDYVECIQFHNNIVYAGGHFTMAGGNNINRIGRFAYVPPAPLNLTYIITSPGSVQLNWAEFHSDEDGFVVQRRDLPDTNWVTIDSTGMNITAYLNTGLTPGSYSYRIYAYNNLAGNSGYSNTIPVNILTPPNPPHSLSLSVPETGVVFLSWTDSSSTENGFVVQRRDNINTNWVNTDTTITDSVTSIQTGLIVGRTYDWRVYAYNSGGNSGYSNVVSSMITGIESNSSIPDKYALYNNYPNPFNPTTKIKFDIPESGIVKLAIYDVLGRQVSTLVNNELSAGRYEMEWSAGSYSSGIYFYRIEAEGFTDVKRMMLVK